SLLAFLDPKNQLYSPKTIDQQRKDLYYENWSFMVQQDLGHDFIAEVGYIGSEGHHLFSKYTINLIDAISGKHPLANFGSYNYKTNDGNSNFNALQTTVHHRFIKGLLLQGNYTYGHTITDASIGSDEAVTFQNIGCQACD